MDLKLALDTDVVYAILAAIVAIIFIVNFTRIMRLRAKKYYVERPKPYDQEATWPQRQTESPNL